MTNTMPDENEDYFPPLPEKITKENMFLDKEMLNPEDEHPFLNNHMNLMFRPSDEDLDDQCFNLNYFLAAMILPRLIWYRDNCPSCLLGGIGYSPSQTEEGFEEIKKKELDKINYIIQGFWLYINSDTDYNPEYRKHWKKARLMLAFYWERLWF